jgi:predicted metal-binding protein
MSDGPKRSVAELVACESCGSKDRDERGLTRGQRLIEQLRAAITRTDAQLTLSTVSCLWVCDQGCSVHLRSAQRVGYVLGSLAANESTAQALIEYVKMYAESDAGAVPYRLWPEALKGHFLCRIPRSPEPPKTEPPSGNEDTPCRSFQPRL